MRKESLRRIVVSSSGGKVEFRAEIMFEDGGVEVILGSRQTWAAAVKAKP